MKQVSVKILALFLSLIVVFSTVSFAVEKHECGGKITDVAVFGESEKCSPMMEMDDCETNSQKSLSFNKHTCCKDLSQIIQSSIVVEKSTKTVEIQVVEFVKPFEISIKLFEGLSENIIPFKNYFPPKLVPNISILYQTFLI
ncbi:MAG: hypothetical protein Q8J84_05220 [Flavobacteriaceae bacterium]|nr:hypothetical protein [Flavobacteriaceae bacterium]